MPAINKGLSIVFTITFIKWLNKPFDEWPAFKLGLINEKGVVIRKPKTREERKLFNGFSNLVRNLKKLLLKVPGGKSKFATVLTTVALLKENNEFNMDLMLELLEKKYMINQDFSNTPMFEEFNNDSFLLFDTIYNVLQKKSAIKVTPEKVETVNMGRHQILKISDVNHKIYFI